MVHSFDEQAAGASTPARQGPSARGDRRRMELVRAGMECLVREGWPGLTHRKVAQQADATAGLVHYHFGNLAGLRSAIARHASDHLILPGMEQLCATASVDELTAAAVRLTTASLEDLDEVRLLTQIVIGTAHYDDVAAVIGADLDAGRRRLAGHLLRLHSGWSEAEARGAAALFIAALDGILLHGLVGTPAPPQPAQLERLFRSVLTARG